MQTNALARLQGKFGPSSDFPGNSESLTDNKKTSRVAESKIVRSFNSSDTSPVKRPSSDNLKSDSSNDATDIRFNPPEKKAVTPLRLPLKNFHQLLHPNTKN